MKITDQTRFPHPVLNSQTHDFKSDSFEVELEVHEKPSASRLVIVCNAKVSEQDINCFVEAGTAVMGLFVTCLNTYYNKLDHIKPGVFTIDYPQGALYGRVTLRPVIWAKKDIKNWKSENIHEEFGTVPIDLSKGAILALGEESIINVGQEKLVPIETIFSLALNDEISEREIGLQLDGDKITILVAPNTYNAINGFRGGKPGKSILLNSIYLPAVMEVLNSLSENAEAYESRRWYRPFTAKCDHLSVDLDAPALWEDAQKLLMTPFGKLLDIREDFSG